VVEAEEPSRDRLDLLSEPLERLAELRLAEPLNDALNRLADAPDDQFTRASERTDESQRPFDDDAHGVVEWAGEPVGETGPDSPERADDPLPCALPIAPEEREEGAQNAEDQIPGALNDGPHKLEAGADHRSNLITEYRAEKGTDTIQRPADHRSDCVEPGLDEVRNRRQSDRRDLLDGVPCTSPIALERRGDGGPDGQDDVPPRLKHTNDGVPHRLHVVGDLVAEQIADTVDDDPGDV